MQLCSVSCMVPVIHQRIPYTHSWPCQALPWLPGPCQRPGVASPGTPPPAQSSPPVTSERHKQAWVHIHDLIGDQGLSPWLFKVAARRLQLPLTAHGQAGVHGMGAGYGGRQTAQLQPVWLGGREQGGVCKLIELLSRGIGCTASTGMSAVWPTWQAEAVHPMPHGSSAMVLQTPPCTQAPVTPAPHTPTQHSHSRVVLARCSSP
jgi:hypothetical protein